MCGVNRIWRLLVFRSTSRPYGGKLPEDFQRPIKFSRCPNRSVSGFTSDSDTRGFDVSAGNRPASSVAAEEQQFEAEGDLRGGQEAGLGPKHSGYGGVP